MALLRPLLAGTPAWLSDCTVEPAAFHVKHIGWADRQIRPRCVDAAVPGG
jgi:hypothetical protein